MYIDAILPDFRIFEIFNLKKNLSLVFEKNFLKTFKGHLFESKY
jgi:hypothetical protein